MGHRGVAHPREVIEAALAHRLQDRVEAAYARGDLFTKRRKLMEYWAAFLARGQRGLYPVGPVTFGGVETYSDHRRDPCAST